MTVKQLNRDQLTELKKRMIDDEISETEGRSASYGELANAESIPDEKVFERYDGIEFVEEAFVCTTGKEEIQVCDARHRDGRVTVRDRVGQETHIRAAQEKG